MAWTTPKTFVNGAVLTAADMNTYVSDNTDYLFDNLKVVSVQTAFISGSVTASLASGAGTAITGLSITHATEDATNQVMLVANVGLLMGAAANGECGISFAAGGTAIGVGTSPGSRTPVATYLLYPGSTSASFLHSPASTSSITYTVRMHNMDSTTQTLYVNRYNPDTNNATFPAASSNFYLLEVAA